jgi:hypothetical protein
MYKFLLQICLIILPALGCSTFEKDVDQREPSPAFDGVSKVYPWADVFIAEYAVEHLAAIYKPELTVVSLDTSTPFGIALEKALQKRSFTIFRGGIPVSYVFDMLNQGSCYLKLTTPDGTITQCYYIYNGSVSVYPNYIKTGFGDIAAAPPSTAVLLAQNTTNQSAAASIMPLGQTYTPKAWRLLPGLLRPQLEEWAEKAGYQIIWKSRHDYNLDSASEFKGEFTDVMQELVLRMHEQGNPLRVTVYLQNYVAEISED